MAAQLKDVKCSQCGGATTVGDVRSGILSFGAFFIAYIPSKKSILGAPKLKSGMSNDRVLSFSCNDCGFISNYLEGKLGQ